MDASSTYDTSGYRSAQAALRASGLASTVVHLPSRPNRRPVRRTVFDERARVGTGDAPTPRGGTYQTGLMGEELVADAFVRAGWKVLGHRVRTKVGEIDLVARQGSTIVFAEVKTASPGRLNVELAVDAKSRTRIRHAAVVWMSMNRPLQRGVKRYRFDVFLVHKDAQGGIVRVDQIRDAF